MAKYVKSIHTDTQTFIRFIPTHNVGNANNATNQHTKPLANFISLKQNAARAYKNMTDDSKGPVFVCFSFAWLLTLIKHQP